ncbi:MAG: hypothetical protein V4709_06330 [Pseudomonadota bacterium]
MERRKPDYILLGLGVFLVIVPLIFAVGFEKKYATVAIQMRLISSLGGALIGAWLPGLLQVRIPGIRAGGAFAVLVLFYLFDPPLKVNNAVTDAVEGDKTILNMEQPPDLSKTKAYKATAVTDFILSGDACFSEEKAVLARFNLAARPLLNRDNVGVEFKRNIYPHYYLTARLSGDDNITTLELQGLGPEDKETHFILFNSKDNDKNTIFLWAGEGNENNKAIDVSEHYNKNKYNKLGMYHYGRYAVLFLNDKKVASFDTGHIQRPGRVGVAFKRTQLESPDDLSTQKSKDAVASFDSFTVYEFEKET